MKRVLFAIMLMVLLTMCALPAVNADLEASDEVAIADSDLEESGARVACDEDGNFHLIHDQSDENTYDVLYKKLSPEGDLLYGITGIGPSGINGRVRWMEIAVDGVRTSHIVFSLRLDSDEVSDIFYTKISNDGEVLVPAKRIFTSLNDSSIPDIGADDSGNAYITWGEGQDQYIYWMKLSSDGTTAVDARPINGELGFGGLVGRPRIGVNSQGTSFIAYGKAQNQLTPLSIVYASVSSQGEILVDPVEIASDPVYSLTQNHAALDSRDRLHVTFVENDNSYYSIIDSDGAVLLDQQTIADPVVGEAWAPDICVDELDNAYTSYQQRELPGEPFTIYVRRRGTTDSGWSSEVMLGEDGSGMYPRMGAGPKGAGVAYLRSNNIYWSLVLDGVVNTSNNAPYAVLSASTTTAKINQTITFNGSASYDPDPDDTVEEYWFKWGDDSDTGWINSSVQYHLYYAPGTYTVNLWVKDSAGKESEVSDSVVITVTDNMAVNQPPEAALTASEQDVDLGSTVTFDATGSTDADGYVAEYFFDYGDGKNTGWIEQSIKSHKYLEKGEYTAKLQVKDDEGEISTNTAMVVVSVTKQNIKPMAIIESIRPNPAKEGEEVEFSGFGLDDDGQIAGYEWSSNKDGVLSANSVFVTKNLSTGLHSVTFKVKDDAGEWSDTYLQDVIIEPNEAPEIDDYTEDDRSDTDTVVIFKARYTDPENDRPTSAKLVYSLDEQTWEEFLDAEDPYDDDYTDGKDYFVELKIVEAGTYTYWFEFENANNGAVESSRSTMEIEHTEAAPGPGMVLILVVLGSVTVALRYRKRR